MLRKSGRIFGETILIAAVLFHDRVKKRHNGFQMQH